MYKDKRMVENIKKKSKKRSKGWKRKRNQRIYQKRFALDTTNPKRVLNSLLEWHHSKIVLDKVLVNSNKKFENVMLITDDKEVKDKVVRHF